MTKHLERLISPSPKITDSIDREKARLLASLLLVRGIALILITIGFLFGVFGNLDFTQTALVLGFTLALNIIGYVFSRTRSYCLGCGVMLFESLVAVTTYSSTQHSIQGVVGATVWFGISILVCSLIWKSRNTAIAIGLTIVGYGIIFYFNPPELYPYISVIFSFFLAESALVYIGSLMRERSEARLKLEHANFVQASRLAQLGEMAGGVAHEINTPLAIIDLKVDYLLELANAGKLTPSELSSSLNLIHETSRRIAKIVRGLITFSGPTRDNAFNGTKVANLLQESLLFCGERLKSEGIKFELVHTGSYEELSIVCNHVELSKVFLTLINNAYDAVKEHDSRWIRLEISELGDWIQFNVVDSGPGIAPEVQKKLMQPFFTTKKFGQGSGLNLSIAKGIVEGHKGRIYFDENRENTAFTVFIPKDPLSNKANNWTSKRSSV